MKGKIAVIDSCFRCPYKAFDNTIGIVFSETKTEEHSSEVCYCGYNKVGYDESQIRIEKYLEPDWNNWKPTKDDPDYPTMPKNCPLPNGNDKRNLRKGKYFSDKLNSLKIWWIETKCEFLGHKQGELDLGDAYNCERCYHPYSKETRNKSVFELLMKWTICKWNGHNRNNWWIGKYRPKYCSRCGEYLGK